MIIIIIIFFYFNTLIFRLSGSKEAFASLGIHTVDDLKEACETPELLTQIQQTITSIDFVRLKKALNIPSQQPITSQQQVVASEQPRAVSLGNNEEEKDASRDSARIQDLKNKFDQAGSAMRQKSVKVRDSLKLNASWVKFIQTLGIDTKIELSFALGVVPGATDYSIGLGAWKLITKSIDTTCGSCFCGLPLCYQSSYFCCFQTAEALKLISEIEKAGIDLNELPQEKKFIKSIILSYYQEAYGFNSDQRNRPPVKYSFQQTQNIRKFVKDHPDFYVGIKMIRLLRAGNADFRIGPPFCYKICAENVPGFGCCYGGSATLGQKLVQYLSEAGVPYEEVERAMSDFENLWKNHLKNMILQVLQNPRHSIVLSQSPMER